MRVHLLKFVKSHKFLQTFNKTIVPLKVYTLYIYITYICSLLRIFRVARETFLKILLTGSSYLLEYSVAWRIFGDVEFP
jgi:hypothetical protein